MTFFILPYIIYIYILGIITHILGSSSSQPVSFCRSIGPMIGFLLRRSVDQWDRCHVGNVAYSQIGDGLQGMSRNVKECQGKSDLLAIGLIWIGP